MKTKQFEEAIKPETPNDVIENIIARSDKFETIRVLMEILCKELGIGPDASPKTIFDKIAEVTTEYYQAMEAFKELRNGNQGRDGKNIQRDENNGKNDTFAKEPLLVKDNKGSKKQQQ